MEIKGEKLTREQITPQKNCETQKYDPILIYHSLIDEIRKILTDRGVKLTLSDEYKNILGQIALWYSKDVKFKGNLRKGIMLRGGVGTGKTVIITALKNLILKVEKKYCGFVYSVDLQDLYQNQKIDDIFILKQRE